MKRITACILVILCFSLIAACASGETGTETAEMNYDESSDIDLDGVVFRWGSAWSAQFKTSGAKGISSAEDKMLQRYAVMKNKYGIDMDVVQWEDGTGETVVRIAASLPTPDILDGCTDNTGYPMYRLGNLYALEDISTIDPTDMRWGGKNFLQYGRFGDKQYGFYQWMWEYMPEFAGTLIFNTELVRRYGGTSPYELQDSGNWNWDGFENWLQSMYGGCTSDGISLFVTETNTFDTQSFILSNGIDPIAESSPGSYYLAWDCPEAYAALEYMKKLSDLGLYNLNGGGKNMMCDEKAVISATESYEGTHFNEASTYICNVLDDFGYMPFPYGPNGTPDTVSAFVHQHRRLNWILMSGPNDEDTIGAVMNILFDGLDENMTEPAWKYFAYHTVFLHDQDAYNYCYMLENIKFNFSVQMGGAYNKLTSALLRAAIGKSSPAETFQECSEAVNTEISERADIMFFNITD